MVTAAPTLRVVFFGTPEFAVPTLQALHESRHPVVGVVTQPDRARGRGQKAQAGAVKQFAEHANLSILHPISSATVFSMPCAACAPISGWWLPTERFSPTRY